MKKKPIGKCERCCKKVKLTWVKDWGAEEDDYTLFFPYVWLCKKCIKEIEGR